MKTGFQQIIFPFFIVLILLSAGCATPRVPAPLTYAAVTRPDGPVKSGGVPVDMEQSRSGFYFMNAGFRPAPDILAYLEEAQAQSGSAVLRNADVTLIIPFYFNIFLCFGFQSGSDTVTVNP